MAYKVTVVSEDGAVALVGGYAIGDCYLTLSSNCIGGRL
jgi:hypothetical protein